MAASMWTMNGPWGRMAGVLVLCTLMLSNEVMCQEPETSTLNPTTTRPPADISSAALTTETPATATQPPSDAAGPQNPDSAISTSDDVESEKSSAIPTAATSAPADEVDDGNVSKTSATGESQAAQSSGSGSPVFVGVLVTGLLLALGLIVGYCTWESKRGAKGATLADKAYPVDQENQANTLESVAPLNPPPETQEKPNENGESPEAPKTEPPPPTNGHSTAKTADTEL